MLGVQGKIDDDKHEDGLVKQASGEGPAKDKDEPEVRRLSVAPTLKRRSSSTLSSIADLDLAELSLLDVLTQAATDVLGSIPAQRCIVYIYDKAANLLRPQVVVDCHDREVDEGGTPEGKQTETIKEDHSCSSIETSHGDANGEQKEEGEVKSPLVSFPPVVGMVSSSFLQRRCLRMQEPNPHRTFHREYDAPKDMQVDSILCAPVILYHRATAVIQLLNRLDTAGERTFEEVERAATPQDVKSDLSSEIRLRRLKTVKVIVKTGFSTKDEQKLLHFTTHIAQTIEMNTKKLANGRSHAKIREDKAKQALDLLNALNGKIVARVDSTEMLMPTNVTEHSERNIYMRQATITRIPSHKGVLTDMLSALVVIMRLQAIFRGRRQRRAEEFAEELEKFRRQRERMRTLVVMHRVIRTPEEPKPRVYEKPQINRAKGGSSGSRMRVEEPNKPASPTKPPPTTPTTPRPLQQPVAPAPRPPTQPSRIQTRRMSATKIQKVFRQHRQKRQQTPPRVPTPAKYVDEKLAKETASAVKVQSFVRGNLVRKRLRQALLFPKGPRIICLRIAKSSTEVVSNQKTHDSPSSTKLRSQTCVDAMPGRPSKSHRVYRPNRQTNDVQEEAINDSHTLMHASASHNQSLAMDARRLVAVHKADSALRCNAVKSPARRSKPRLVSAVVWESPQQSGQELPPPGVEFVKSYRPIGDPQFTKRQSGKVSSPRASSMTFCNRDSKPGVKLPALASRPLRDPGESALLCCLLPSQTKRLTCAYSSPRPIAKMTRMVFKAKRRHSPAKATASDAVA